MKEKIFELLVAGDFAKAAEMLQEATPEQAAEIISSVNEEYIVSFCREIDSDFLADVLVLLETERQQKIIEGLRDDELQEVMDEVSPEDTADIIEELPQSTALKIAEEEEITILFNERKFSTLKPLLASMNEVDIAKLFKDLPDEELPILFRLLPKDLAADVFVELDSDDQEQLLEKLTNVELKEVMNDLFIDDYVDIVEEMPANVVKRVLALTDNDTRTYVNDLLKYPKDSAGSIMTVEFIALTPDMTVRDAFDRIREKGVDSETIYTCYVIAHGNKLIGTVTAKELLLASYDKRIGDIMEENVIYAHTKDDREDVARKLANYGFMAIPIVDEENRLVGIVTVDDAIDVLQAENTEDIANMAGTIASEKPYLKTSVFETWKNRIPCLLVLMVSATFTGLIINTFESRLNLISTVLFACVPMIMDTGGNAGSQASVTVIRSLALNELKLGDVLKVMWKEVRVSILLGVTLGIACFGKLMLIDNLLFGYADYTPFLCLIVSFALMCTVIVAKIVGSSLPMIAKACKLDPAVVASPFITTIVDAVSLILYCGLAIALLG